MNSDTVDDRDGKDTNEDGDEKSDPKEETDFSFFYEISDKGGEFFWSEMSYHRYEKPIRWDENDFEPTELELYQSEIYV